MNELRGSCGCAILMLVFNLVLGGVSVWYVLKAFGLAIPWYGNMLIGLFAGEVSVPAAVILWLLQLFGVGIRVHLG